MYRAGRTEKAKVGFNVCISSGWTAAECTYIPLRYDLTRGLVTRVLPGGEFCIYCILRRFLNFRTEWYRLSGRLFRDRFENKNTFWESTASLYYVLPLAALAYCSTSE